MYVKYLKCSRCGRTYTLDSKPLMCSNRDLGRLEIFYDYDSVKAVLTKKRLSERPFNMWRYLELLPLPSPEHIVTLEEGGTPLIKAKRLGEELGLKNLYLKDETRNPTGSFKDRCMSVAVSMAKYFGFSEAVTASSGNAAASLAAYGAKAGIKVYAFVPHFAAHGKIAQLLLYGARVFKIRWTTAEDPTVKMMQLVYEKYQFYMSPSFGPFNPYQVEGAKTISMEIAEQLNFKVPDQVFIPVGAGSLLTGVFKGFRDFNELGLVNGIPKLVAVQPLGNHPLVRAWFEREDPTRIKPWDKPPDTIATGLEDTYPWDGDAALKAVYETNGYGVVVSDNAIIESMKLLASLEGIFAEPSGAASLAGLIEALRNGYVDKDEVVVVLITGHGLKDPDIVRKIVAEPPTIEPDLESFEKTLRFYAENRL